MRSLLSLSLFCCMFCTTLAGGVTAQTSAAQEGDVIRIDVDVTNLLFTAADKRNRFITTLREEDIRVLENGVPQQLFTFQRETDLLLSIAFLIDVSASEERTLPQEKAAVRSFVETVIRSRKDEAAIIPFTGYAFLEQALTGSVTSIYQALNRVDVALPSYLGSGPQISGIASGPGVAVPREGSTAIWDAITVTASEVLARSPGKKRRAIILLTDGQDTSSRLPRSAAIDQAIAAEAVIYAIGIGDSKHFEGVNGDALRTVAERTGGRAFFPKKEADLTAAFQQIEQELRSQYLVAYSSTNKRRDGSYRQMRIEITNPELRKEQLRLRYRPGYFAKSS
jgi:Ca-activated chloride channel family protein